jgi:hypothetical protein
MKPSRVSRPPENVILDLEKTGLDGCRAAQPPQQTGQPQDEFTLNGRLRIVVGSHGRLEGLVVFRILHTLNDSLCCQTMADGIATGAPVSCFARWARALECIASIGLDLPE